MNRFKTMILLAILTALFVWVGDALGGTGGMVIALAFALIMNFGAYWFSDQLILKLHGAQPVSESDAPELYRTVRELATQAGIPMPAVYAIREAAPNAFATGRSPDHAAVAVTSGILEILSDSELRAVLAHELGHVKNRDTLVSTVAATFAGALSMLANMAMWAMFLGRGSEDRNPLAGLVGIIVAPIAASIIQMAISRSREFLADESGANLSGQPEQLASALEKIEHWSRRAPMRHGTPATAHLFIINPFAGERMAGLFSTHPPTKERVRRLLAMRGGPAS